MHTDKHCKQCYLLLKQMVWHPQTSLRFYENQLKASSAPCSWYTSEMHSCVPKAKFQYHLKHVSESLFPMEPWLVTYSWILCNWCVQCTVMVCFLIAASLKHTVSRVVAKNIPKALKILSILLCPRRLSFSFVVNINIILPSSKGAVRSNGLAEITRDTIQTHILD